MDRERALNLSAAAQLAGIPLRELRRHLKEGHLPSTTGHDGKPRVTVGDLIDAGLVPGEIGERSAGGNGRDRAALVSFGDGGEAGEILRRLLVERESAASAWKERTDALYRELIDDQKERVQRLEAENRQLTQQLHDALRQVPKLLELEKVEASARDAEAAVGQARQDAESSRTEAETARAEAERARRELQELQAELARAEQARANALEQVARLRSRGLWSRVVDRDPGQSSRPAPGSTASAPTDSPSS